jgi:hypothetical protein
MTSRLSRTQANDNLTWPDLTWPPDQTIFGIFLRLALIFPIHSTRTFFCYCVMAHVRLWIAFIL